MKLALRPQFAAQSGFTLLETMVALTIFTALAYGLISALSAGAHSQLTVIRVSAEDRSLRAATTDLCDELKSSSDTTISIATLADSNHRIRFQQPIDLGGVAGWGVYDRTLGPDPASQNQAGWHVQYTVRANALGQGAVNRQLVRQVLDDQQVVRRERVIADGLCSGTDTPPGFRVIQVGDLWRVTLSTVDRTDGTTGIRAVFDVQTRN
jgi:prepilin-type N-terminal cleavage/methylation domain-containing protein